MDEAQLKDVLAAHQEWLASGKARGRQASLARQDLRFANLANADLTEAVLTEANLERTSMVGARLDRADLRGANVMYADATGAQLSQANLVGGRLDGARLDHVNLSESKLGNATLEHASLKQATLTGCNASGARFGHADLTLCDLDRCVLNGADFSGATLAHASLRGASLDRARLPRAIMTGADIEGASFRDADLTDAVLISVRLASASLDGAKIDHSWDGPHTLEEGATGAQHHDQSPLQQLAAAGEERLRLAKASRELELARLAFRRCEADDEQSRQLSKRMVELEDERRILAHDIQRAEQEAARVQADYATRVAAAVTVLRVPTSRSTSSLRRLRTWGMTLKALALTALAAAVATLAPVDSRWRLPINGQGLDGVPVPVVLLLLLAAGLFWLDLQNTREVARTARHRARIEEAAAVLQASQFVSHDVIRTQHVVESTFAMVRAALVDDIADERIRADKRER